MPSTLEINESGLIPLLEISTPRSTLIEIVSKGPKGDPGEAGDAQEGDSAYQVAVNNGFVGTEVAWLASLVGEAGEAGAAGATGPAGIEVVEHGADPNVARPAFPLVYWVGTATPNNAETYDFWLDE